MDLANSKRLSVPAERAKPVEKKNPSSRQRALEFAKNVPKPRAKPKKVVKEESPKVKEASKLAELEQRHFDYRATIDEIRSKM